MMGRRWGASHEKVIWREVVAACHTLIGYKPLSEDKFRRFREEAPKPDVMPWFI